MYHNVVVGTPLIEPMKLLAKNKDDWINNEHKYTLFTNTRYLPLIMKEAGIVNSTGEVKRNKPELCVYLNKVDCIEIKWGKKFLYIIIGQESN